MELLTILLSALLGLLSPIGWGIDRLAESAIQDSLDSAESLEVRIDNTPNYQLLQGKVDRVRIAGRGLYPTEGLRIAVLEVETDAIDLNSSSLRQGNPELEQPLQAAVKLVLTEADLNQALRSDRITDQLNNLNLDFLGTGLAQYDLIDPQVEFLPESSRIRVQVTLQRQQTNLQSTIVAEVGVQRLSSQQIQLVQPIITFDGEAVPAELLNYLLAGINQRLNFSNWEDSGLTARILELEVEADQITLISFIRLEPNSRFLNRGS